MSKSDNRTIKATVLYLVCSFLQKAISIITIPIFTRIMAADQFGIFSVYTSWSIVLTVFVSLNFGWDSVLNGFRDFKDSKYELINSVQVLSLLVSVGYLVLTIMMPGVFERVFALDVTLIRLVFIQLSVSSAYDMWCALQRYEFKYRQFCAVTLIYTIVPVFISLVTVVLCNSANTAQLRAYSTALSSLAIAGALFLWNAHCGHYRVDMKYWKYALALNLPLVPHYLSRTLLNQLDHIMVKSIEGSQKAAVYSLAYSIGLLPNMLTLAINNALAPWIYRMIDNRTVDRIARVTKVIGLLLLFLISMLMICAPEVVAIFAPQEYRQSIYIIPTVAASTYVIYIYTVLSSIEIYYASTSLIMVGSIIATLFNALTNYVLINAYGYVVAGYTTLASYLIILAAHFIQYTSIVKDTECSYIDSRFVFLSLAFISFLAFLCPFAYDYPMLRISMILVTILTVFLEHRQILALLKTALNDYRL